MQPTDGQVKFILSWDMCEAMVNGCKMPRPFKKKNLTNQMIYNPPIFFR